MVPCPGHQDLSRAGQEAEVNLEQAQVVRLRARTFLRRSLKEGGVSSCPVADRPALFTAMGVTPSRAKAKAVSLPAPEGARDESLEADEFLTVKLLSGIGEGILVNLSLLP